MGKLLVYIAIFCCTLGSVRADSFGVSLGPFIKTSLVQDNLVWLTGARLGVTFDKEYYIGLSLYGTTFDSYKPNVQDLNYILYPDFNFNFIGLEAEYNISPDSEIFPSICINNGISLAKFDIPYSIDKNGQLYNPNYRENTVSYYIEPSINLNFNFKSFYKMSLCLSYRYALLKKTAINGLVENNSQFYLDNSYLNGLNLAFSVRFGRF